MPASRIMTAVAGAALWAAGAPLWATDARAGQATCSNPGLPVGSVAATELAPWRLSVSLTTSVAVVRGEQQLVEPSGPVDYDAEIWFSETQLSGELALSPWLAFGATVPYRTATVGVTYRDPDSGDEVSPGSAGTHARDETLRGLGDPTVHVHLARELGATRLHARLGTSLPLGGTVEDPFALGAIGQEHQHVQFGTGTFIPYLAVEAQRAVGAVTVGGWALARLSVSENEHGFRAGDRYSVGATAALPVATRALTLGFGAELHAETAEEWHGAVSLDEGNAGRRDLFAGVSASWRPRADLAVIADVKLPIYSAVEGSQLDYTAVMGVGIAGTFDLRPRPSWRGLDRAALEPAGTAAPLVAVPGRITVFDFWAEWCPPCRAFDVELARLVRRYSDRVAVRTLDVVDTDSEAWSRYVAPAGDALPHVKVVGPDGALLLEMSGTPAELIRAIEALLRE